MALGRAFSVAVRGLDGEIVEIEADITSGLPGVHLVGLPDAALQESRDRVRAAITNCGNNWPMARLTLALSPATLPKMGSVYDLALAAAVLSAHRKKEWARLEKTVLLGELALDGRVRPVKGVLPAVLAAKREGWPAVVVPIDNLAEASLVDGIEVLGARTLGQLQAWLAGKAQLDERVEAPTTEAEVRGRPRRRRRPDPRQVRRRGRRRRCAPPDADRPARRRQNNAGATASGPAAGADAQRVARGHRDPLGGRAAVGRHAADHPAAVRRAAPHVERGRAGRRRHRGWRGRVRSAARTAACCSSTSAPRSGPARWRRCERRWRTARFGWPAATAWRGIRPGSSWCWRPTRVRARRPIRSDCICASAVKRRYLGKLSGPLLDRVDLRV